MPPKHHGRGHGRGHAKGGRGHGHHKKKHHRNKDQENWDDYDWDDLWPEFQQAAETLGWTQDSWDHDKPSDVETEHQMWNQLTQAQREAARIFGYNKHMWDQDIPPHEWNKDHKKKHGGKQKRRGSNSSGSSKEGSQSSYSSESSYSSGDDDDDDVEEDYEVVEAEEAEPEPVEKEEVVPPEPEPEPEPVVPPPAEEEEAPPAEEEAAPEPTPPAVEPEEEESKFEVSEMFGGPGGGGFDHGNNLAPLTRIVMYTDGHTVKGLHMEYGSGEKKMCGTYSGGTREEYTLDDKEYVNIVKVRHGQKFIQSLEFCMNTGNSIQCGGKGWQKTLFKKKVRDEEGPVTEVVANFGQRLVGVMGRSGTSIDAIAFRWGPHPS